MPPQEPAALPISPDLLGDPDQAHRVGRSRSARFAALHLTLKTLLPVMLTGARRPAGA